VGRFGGGFGLDVCRRRGAGAPAWTPASLPAGRVLRWHQGRSLASFADASDGTGSVAADGAAGAWADSSAADDRARQATSGRRPKVRRHPRGRGVYVEGSATAGTGGNYLAGASSVTGCKWAYVVATVIGPNNTRDADPDPDPLFLGTYRGFAGLAPVATGAILLTGDTGTGEWMAGSLDEYARDGSVIAIASAAVGYGRTRYVFRVRHGSTADAGALNLLRHVGFDGYYAYGGLHEVLLLSGDTTAGELAQIDSYMASYWLGGPAIVITGDSLMAGYGMLEAQGPAALIAEHFEGCIPVPCIAVPGQGFHASTSGGLPTLLVDDQAKLETLQRSHSPFVVVCLAGTNDLATAQGRSAAQLYADIQTYCAMVQAMGGKVIVGTIASRSDGAWSVGSEAQRVAYNTLLRDDHSFADGFADIDLIDPARQADAVHWTAASTAQVVDLEGGIIEAIEALLASDGLVAHYDLSVATARWQDTAATSAAAADADPVRRVDDLTGSGRHLLLGSVAVPALATDGGGDGTKPALECTGGSFLASAAACTSRASTLVYVGKITSGGAVGHTPTASAQGDYLYQPNEVGASRGSLQLGGFTLPVGAWHVYALRVEPGGALPRRLWVDGVETGSSSAAIGSTPLVGKIVVGSVDDAPLYPGTSATCEVRLYDRALPANDIEELSAELMTKWAI
jgi:hypothetical protein